MAEQIDISGLDKGAVLAVLWNNAALPPEGLIFEWERIKGGDDDGR